jgi:hypothetical protein
MSATETYNASRSFLTVIPDAEDWDSQLNNPNGLRVWSILVFPSAAGDQICLKDESDTGPTIFKAVDVEGRGLLIRLPANIIFPYMDYSECTFDDITKVRITFHMA